MMEKEVKTLQLSFSDKTSLYAAYMPYIKNGGVFVCTDHAYSLGEQINLFLKLPEISQQYQILSRVVWLTPKRAQGGMLPGIGVQFLGEHAKKIHDQIENILATLANSENTTDTM